MLLHGHQNLFENQVKEVIGVITKKQSRDKDGEHFEQATLTFKDPLDALASLAKYELGWGGQVVDVSESFIKVQTRVFHCLDTSIFEGPTVEMKPLFELVYFYTKASQEFEGAIEDQAVDETGRWPDGIGRVPLFLSMLAPLVIGSNRLKAAAMLACGLRDENDIKAGLNADIKDIVAAFQLAKDGQCSFREALAL